MYRKRIKLHAKFDVKIKSKAMQGKDAINFAAIEEKKDQTKIYKNVMEMYRKRLKIITSK
jgi:hypothetical protein